MSKNDENNRFLYITNLLTETLPNQLRSTETLVEMNIQRYGCYTMLQIKLCHDLQQMIESQGFEQTASFKHQLNDLLIDAVESYEMKVYGVFNLQPMYRLLVVECISEAHGLKAINQAFHQIKQSVYKQYGGAVMGFCGTFVQDFLTIGSSYKRSRTLQGYDYIIGKGQLAFYQTFNTEAAYSVVEYKYIHLFGSLMSAGDWPGIYDLLLTIKKAMVEHNINNSKTAYIYKEIFSMTIRHLYESGGKYSEAIGRLNQGIINFDLIFDDIVDIHTYYLELFNEISQTQLYTAVHPHIRRVLSIIESQYSDGITLGKIAEELGVTEAYLSRLFKSELDSNFKKYLTSYRMTKAKEQLLNTKESIYQVGINVGYPNDSQFGRAFKAFEGMSPGAFRRYERKR